MKKLKISIVIALAAACIVAPFAGMADDKKDEKKDAKVKPYTLEKCIVSGEKLGEHGDPYVITHEGREIKMCCKSCEKDFKKNSAKYIKQIEEAEKAAKK